MWQGRCEQGEMQCGPVGMSEINLMLLSYFTVKSQSDVRCPMRWREGIWGYLVFKTWCVSSWNCLGGKWKESLRCGWAGCPKVYLKVSGIVDIKAAGMLGCYYLVNQYSPDLIKGPILLEVRFPCSFIIKSVQLLCKHCESVTEKCSVCIHKRAVRTSIKLWCIILVHL